MIRIACLVLSAFALLVGVAVAKTHTVVVTSVALDKTTVVAGNSLIASYKVRNNLGKTSNPRTVRFFLTLDEDGKRGFKGIRLDNAKTPKIAAESTKTLTQPLMVPGSTAAGSYLVLACISGECQATGLRVTVTAAGKRAPVSVPSELAITPTSFDFGHFYGGTPVDSPPKTFVVTNTSTSRTAGPLDFSFGYSDGGDLDEGFFSVDSSTCGVALAPAASCTATVTLHPAYNHNVTAARMSVTDPYTPAGLTFSDLFGQWDCFEPDLRARPSPRC